MEEPGGPQSMGMQRARHELTEHTPKFWQLELNRFVSHDIFFNKMTYVNYKYIYIYFPPRIFSTTQLINLCLQ